MVLLKLLNLMAPCYFLGLLAVTFSLQLFFFLPGMCGDDLLPLSGLLHSVLFVFFLVNVIGNYSLIIWNSPANRGRSTGAEMSNRPFCHICIRMMWEQEHHCFFTGTCIGRSNLRSFVLFCLHASCSCFHAVVGGMGYVSHRFSLPFSSPLTYLRLLPHSVTRFFSGSLRSSEMLTVLMLYLWFGVGLACGAFFCHQLLIISRRPLCHQSTAKDINWMDKMTSVFGKRWLMAFVFPSTKGK